VTTPTTPPPPTTSHDAEATRIRQRLEREIAEFQRSRRTSATPFRDSTPFHDRRSTGRSRP
jgi:hypothetical protein